MKKKSQDLFDKPSMKLFLMLCSYFLLVLVLYTLFQLFKIRNCLEIVQILSVVIPIIFYLFNLKNKNKNKKSLLVIGIYLFLILILPFLYEKTYDITADGNSYHKTAIAFIKNGWNPIYETSKEFQKHNNEVIKIEDDSRVDLWIEHYPKAAWIQAAVMYNMTNDIESGKSITFIFAIMLFIISYNCLQIILSRTWAFIISLLIVLNPITLSQLFSYYVDSLMGIYFSILLFLLLLVKPMEKQNFMLWTCICSICVWFTNIKFTGLLCSGVISCVFYVYWFIKYRKEKTFYKKFKNITLHFIVVFLLAIFFVGSNSYVKNTIEHKNPLYPIIGKDKVDIITTMQPKSFSNKTVAEKFIWSLFSKTENVTYTGGNPQLKWPFMIYKSELNELTIPDTRIAGFGPWFALAFIVCFITFIISFIIFIKNDSKNIKYILLPVISILVSAILVGESWWARYVPQLYLLLIGSLLLTIYISKYMKNKKYSMISRVLIVSILFVNICCFMYVNYNNIKIFISVDNDLQEMSNIKNLELKAGKEAYGYYYNLKDKNINYKIVDEIEEKEKRYMYYWRFEVKKND